jgi:hypothetical protein
MSTQANAFGSEGDNPRFFDGFSKVMLAIMRIRFTVARAIGRAIVPVSYARGPGAKRPIPTSRGLLD